VDRERLDLVLREELAKRAGVTLPASDLALSVAIIRMAAVGLKVGTIGFCVGRTVYLWDTMGLFFLFADSRTGLRARQGRFAPTGFQP